MKITKAKLVEENKKLQSIIERKDKAIASLHEELQIRDRDLSFLEDSWDDLNVYLMWHEFKQYV